MRVTTYQGAFLLLEMHPNTESYTTKNEGIANQVSVRTYHEAVGHPGGNIKNSERLECLKVVTDSHNKPRYPT